MSSSELSGTAGQSATPTPLPEPEEAFSLDKYKATQDAQKLVAWVHSEHTKSAQARTTKVLQWRDNLFMFFGHQWAERVRTTTQIATMQDQFITPQQKRGKSRRTINLTRSFVRAEHSKFLSSIPQALAVPSTAEDQDVRAAFAAEQAWQSISETRKLRQHYTKAAWWAITTGNGFLKTWWDTNCTPDPKVPNDKGDITFGAIAPFNLFVPDLREQEIEDQPYVITAYKKPVSWCQYYFKDSLQGVDLKASTSSSSGFMEEATLNLNIGNNVPDSVTVYEAWVKPGATELLPDGGVAIIVEDTLVGLYREGLPYQHGQYPFAKLEHIPTATFYADSPLVDTNNLQREYNEWRSRIHDYVKTSSAPQLLAQKGAIVPTRITNESGLVIEYKMGYQPPTPLQVAPIPQYVMDQQSIIRQDWEDITGQHEVSRGQAPAGVTAGTAINYLQEKDDQFLTPQYQSIEDLYEKVATQSLSLFNQYVDMKRKIKTIGADGAFDTELLQGSDIASGLDVRVQKGSAVGESQAAKEAKLMDLWSIGVIQDPNQLLQMLEMGGTQKVLDVLNVAERKAQRENIKMKMLTPQDIEAHEMQWELQYQLTGNPQGDDPSNVVPQGQVQGPPMPPTVPPVIGVDDFDVHPVHIDTHNKFRMSQEYEALDPAVKAQLDAHVKLHEQMQMQSALMNFLKNMPSDGTDGDAPPDMNVPVGGEDPTQQEDPSSGGTPAIEQGGAKMSGNGAVPAPNLQTEGAS